MRYRGGDLGKEIASAQAKHLQFGVPKVLSWVAQLAMALAYVHKRGVVHRDVKPTNCFLSSAENICLGDFGHGERSRVQ